MDSLESIVLGLVKEYLAKKTFFSITDIIEFVNNRVRLNPNLNKNKIELIIKSLIKKKTIIPGTRLMKNNIIENPKRNEIYNFIKRNPSNINDIMKTLKIGSNQALWHLSCLEKFEFVRSEKLNNHRIFFEIDSNPKLDKFYFYLNKDIVLKIIEFLSKEEKPLKITEIANGMEKNHTTIKKYISILENLKLVETEKEKNRILFKLNLKRYNKVRKLIHGDR
ncbi:MAG: ArsR family transcriptional regulator [Candidatus Lokiarchaeota archaeon]|nr:ArsR family transcriptional regulator [Candidatus Lokiarchaeota archaeon]